MTAMDFKHDDVISRIVDEMGISRSDIRSYDENKRIVKLYNWRKIDMPKEWFDDK